MGFEVTLALALIPIAFWWIGTGLVLRDAHVADRASARALPYLTVALPVSLAGLAFLAVVPASIATAVVSFGLVFVIWAWLEVSFYTGHVTGPVKERCPRHASVVHRLVHALGASAYHEAMMIGLGVTIWALSAQGSRWAPAFFLILAVMHTSARINVVLGVRNLNEHFLPQRLAYLGSLFRKRPWNGLMPVSILGSLVLTIALAQSTAAAHGEPAVGLVLATTLAAIGLLEHLLLVLPLPGHLLFEWGLPGGRGDGA